MPSTRRIFVAVSSLTLLVMVLWMSGWEGVFSRLVRFPPWVTASMLVLLLANLFLVSFRFLRVLKHFGVTLPWKVASRASISGHVAGLFMISILGQVMGRQMVMQNHGTSPLVVSAIAAYERTILAIVSGILGIYGLFYLFGYEAASVFIERISLTEIFFASIGGWLLSLWLGRSNFEKKLSAQAMSWSNVGRVAEIAGITFAGQLFVLGCFVIGILAISPKIEITNLFAAAAAISFAATLPITVNGWGVREMVAVYVLGRLGIPAIDAVTVSVMVGICSTLVIIFVAPFSLKKTEILPIKTPQMGKVNVAEIEKIAAWSLGMTVAVAIFFQAYISLPSGVANLNLADPFAILALAAVSLHTIFSRQLPVWKVSRFNIALGAISILLLAGFIRGWLDIGVTQWALGGRLIGWFVLLGYLSSGYLIVANAGAHALRRFSETIIATASIIVFLQVVLRLLDNWGMGLGLYLTPNFEGYAGNRNAFAFQLLVAIALLLGYSTVYVKQRKDRTRPQQNILFSLLLGILLVGIFLTGSRAGIAVGILLLFSAWYIRIADHKILGWGLGFSIMLWIVIWMLSHFMLVHGAGVQSGFSGDYSNNERFETFIHALDLWRQSPLLGAGLGVFIAKSSAWLGHPQVIHSTPLWILAEFGLVGSVVFGWVFVLLSCHVFRPLKRLPAANILLMLLFVFALFSLVHEIFYQRIFWLLLGALLGQPYSQRSFV